MNAQGLTIFIDPPIDTLVERLQPEKDHRPLISQLSDAELHVFLSNKRMERLPFYSSAKLHLQDQDINEKTC